MDINFNVYKYDYDKRAGSLDAEAKGVVKSEKHFPFFYEEGKKIIYKPLSKTKPLSTPYFAFSEVVWSNIINNFFDDTAPIYRLAKCPGYEMAVPKYHGYGTVVESIVDENEKLVNIYEYFQDNPDEHVNISDYENYCLANYDYTFFFETDLFKKNPAIAKEIAKQILYSVLRADQNYHYENVAFAYEGDSLKRVTKPIDHEFSTIFMYLDKKKEHQELFQNYICGLEELWPDSWFKNLTKMARNINTIVKLYPDLVEDFISSLDNMINHLDEHPIILEDHSYIEPFSSNDYEVGMLRYKKKNEKAAVTLEDIFQKRLLLPEDVSDSINSEILTTSKTLKKTLEVSLQEQKGVKFYE